MAYELPVKHVWAPLVDEAGTPICGQVQTEDAGPNRRFSSALWSVLFRLGKLLTWPAEKTVETYLYIFHRHLKPGRFGQCLTLRQEQARRAILFAYMIPLGALAVLLFPLGALLRFLAVSLGTRDFLFVRPHDFSPDNLPLLAAGSRVRMSVRTQNLGFLPHISSANNLANPMDRVDFLLRELQLGKDDVICFQECFDLAATKAIVERLVRQPRYADGRVSNREHWHQDVEEGSCLRKVDPVYPWIVADCDPCSYRLNSGLAIMSRYPLANPEFVRYTNRVESDRMAGKGVLGCTVVLGATADGRRLKLTVFTTHMQSAGRAKIRQQQLQIASSFIRHYNNKHIHKHQDVWLGSLFVGDFNISPIDGEPDNQTGKLVRDPEWLPMKTFLNAHDMKNLFYEETEDGNLRTRNIDILIQFQDAFAHRLKVLVNELRQRQSRWDQGPNRGSLVRVPIDMVSLINQLTAWLGRKGEKVIPNRKGKEEEEVALVKLDDNFEQVDTHLGEFGEEQWELKAILSNELKHQGSLIMGLHEHDWEQLMQDDEACSDDHSRVLAEMAKLLSQLEGVACEPVVELFRSEQQWRSGTFQGKEKGRGGRAKLDWDTCVEYLVPSTDIDKYTYESKFPNQVNFKDLDHIWSLMHFRGMEARLNKVKSQIIDHYPFFYTDHLGKRSQFEIDLSLP